MKKNKKGFTMIELLAVIVLLGIVVTIAIVTFSSISKNVKERQKENLISTIKVAGGKYLNDVDIYDVYVDTLINQGYLEYDKLNTVGRKLIVDPTDPEKNLNCYKVERNYEDDSISITQTDLDKCEEDIQINSAVQLKYCADKNGTCEPDEPFPNGWTSTAIKDSKNNEYNEYIVLSGDVTDESLNITPANSKYLWITPNAPDISVTTQKYPINIPKGDYINDTYKLTITNNNKNYTASNNLRIDNAAPVVSEISVKCKDGTSNPEDSWCNEKIITAIASDRGVGLSGYKITTDVSECSKSENWTKFEKSGATNEIVYTINKDTLKENIDENGKEYFLCVKDEVGNKNIDQKNKSVLIKNVDVTDPECEINENGNIITIGNDEKYYTGNVGITISPKDIGSGVKNYGLSSNKDDIDFLDGISYKQQTTEAKDITWYGLVKDNVGNVGKCQSKKFSVDLNSPEITSFSVKSNKSYNSVDTTVTLNSKDNVSGVEEICINTSNNYSNCNWLKVTNNNTYPYKILGTTDGSGNVYSLYGFAKDKVGHISPVNVINYKLYKTCDEKNYIKDGGWGSCSRSCGTGTMSRTLYYNDKYLGTSCNVTDTKNCNTAPCSPTPTPTPTPRPSSSSRPRSSSYRPAASSYRPASSSSAVTGKTKITVKTKTTVEVTVSKTITTCGGCSLHENVCHCEMGGGGCASQAQHSAADGASCIIAPTATTVTETTKTKTNTNTKIKTDKSAAISISASKSASKSESKSKSASKSASKSESKSESASSKASNIASKAASKAASKYPGAADSIENAASKAASKAASSAAAAGKNSKQVKSAASAAASKAVSKQVSKAKSSSKAAAKKSSSKKKK